MKLIIHRGAKEIGGSCVEVISDNSRILIDIGIPLVTPTNERFDTNTLKDKSIGQLKALKILPNIKGLYKDEPRSIDAILISHSHLDHYGFLKYIHPDIPIYLSKGAQRLIEISDIFTPNKTGRMNARLLPKKEEIINDFKITNYLVDHSAFDARAFLIETGGKRLFYSGDFRGHGRKSILFKNMLSNPPKNIDCLMMEGSMLGRGKQGYNNETDIQTGIEDILKNKSNIAFLFASAQNIDRFVSTYKACRRTKTTLVIDLYAAYILNQLKDIADIPQFNWPNIRIKYFKAHADRLAEADKKLLYKFKQSKIKFEEIDANKNKTLMLARDNSLFKVILRNIHDTKGANIIYSMWDGYLTDKFKKECNQNGIGIKMVHTSGHAIMSDLKQFAKALSPKILIPIHTFEPQKYRQLYTNVKMLNDGEEFEII